VAAEKVAGAGAATGAAPLDDETLGLTPYGSPRAAFSAALREAAGLPAIVLAASYLGFGSLIRASGLHVGFGLVSTLSAWALPGQVALVELYSVGTSVAVIAAAVAFTNARLLPMVVVLMPYLRRRGMPRVVYYVAAHLIAVTGWIFAIQRCPMLPERERLPYFWGFTLVLWAASLTGVFLGFKFAALLPTELSLGLVFLNALYFLLIFAGDLRDRARMLALLLGALLGPLSAAALQQKRSFLEGKLGERVGSERLDLADDPLVPRGLGSRLFDGEGLAARRLTLFERGALRS
jgi:predicted branched-subunit amino acid permease